jgi:ribonuclease J
VILSSKFIPGNEKAINAIINNLYRQGADVVYEKISDIHVSGPCFPGRTEADDPLTRPRYFIPIHGEYRHLVLHARLAGRRHCAKNILLAQDGQPIVFSPQRCRSRRQKSTGRLLIDGKGVGDVGRSVLASAVCSRKRAWWW